MVRVHPLSLETVSHVLTTRRPPTGCLSSWSYPATMLHCFYPSGGRLPQMLIVSMFSLRKMLSNLKQVFPPIPYAWVSIFLFLPSGNYLWISFISRSIELRIVISDLQKDVAPSLVIFTSAPGLGLKQVWLSMQLETQQEDFLFQTSSLHVPQGRY